MGLGASGAPTCVFFWQEALTPLLHQLVFEAVIGSDSQSFYRFRTAICVEGNLVCVNGAPKVLL